MAEHDLICPSCRGYRYQYGVTKTKKGARIARHRCIKPECTNREIILTFFVVLRGDPADRFAYSLLEDPDSALHDPDAVTRLERINGKRAPRNRGQSLAP